MKLNLDIIYQGMKEYLPVVMTGQTQSEMCLSQPEFYLDRAAVFADDHVYVCSADHLPAAPQVGRNVVLICLGESPQLDLFRRMCSVLSIPENEDIFAVFNTVQAVFNRYEQWEESLNTILRGSASLQEMLDASRLIFGNPMLLVGADFRYLAYTDEEYLREHLGMHFDTPAFDENLMATFLSLHDLATDIKEPLLLELMGRKSLSVNLFDMDEYLGCITLFAEYREFRSSDAALCIHFSHMLRQALQRDPVLAGERSAVRRAVGDLIDGLPPDPEQRRVLSHRSSKEQYLCAVFEDRGEGHPLPHGYVASVMEQRFPGALAFEHDGRVVALLPSGYGTDSITRTALTSALVPVLENTRLRGGLSQSFSDLYTSAHAYFQASAALQNGMQFRKEEVLYFFEDHILHQLLRGALSGQPADSYYPEGFKRLLQHDASSPISYAETLRIYLQNNESIAATAKELALHRSSLIDRLERIRQLLGLDLSDPDVRLLLQVILRSETLFGDEAYSR